MKILRFADLVAAGKVAPKLDERAKGGAHDS